MSILVANRGQTERISFFIQFTDATGAAADATGAVSLPIYRSNPDGTLTLKTTLTPTKQQSLTGWYGAFLDIADATVWPEGLYVARWSATIAGVASASTEPFQIIAAALPASVAALASAYCTEAMVRETLRTIDDTNAVPSGQVAAQAARAASVIDGALAAQYVVPFTLPAPALVASINAWLAAAYALIWAESEQGRRSKIGEDVEKRALALLDKLVSNEWTLPGAPLATEASGPAVAASTTEDTSPFFTFASRETPDLSGY